MSIYCYNVCYYEGKIILFFEKKKETKTTSYQEIMHPWSYLRETFIYLTILLDIELLVTVIKEWKSNTKNNQWKNIVLQLLT